MRKFVSIPGLLVLAALVIFGGVFVFFSLNATMEKTTPAGGNKGRFSNICFYSHSVKDDPIVFPGHAGASHMHDFIGNSSTNASSTLKTLEAASTNCVNKKDLAAYWVPTLMKGDTMKDGMMMGGTPIHPGSVTVYYLSNGKANVKPYPQGLKEIAGNARATSASQEHNVLWGCSASPPTLSVAPTCKNGAKLYALINFADCWDGKHLDSSDHVSHVAYSDGKGHCPTGFPVPVPQLSILLKYPTSGGSDIMVASGPTYTMHADFFNAWHPGELQRQVTTCLDTGIKCAQPTESKES